MNMCYMVCAPLQSFLEQEGKRTELIEGEVYGRYHFWLRLPDGRIIDPTADQFFSSEGAIMPKIYIGKQPLWYKGLN